MDLTRIDVVEIPEAVQRWCEAHSVSTTTAFCQYLEYIDGEIVGRTFATRTKKKQILITEVLRLETGSNTIIVRNLLRSSWGGYYAIYKEEDVYYRCGGYPYKVFAKTDFNKWADADGNIGFCYVTINSRMVNLIPEFKHCGYTNGDVISYIKAWRVDNRIEFFGKMGLSLSPMLIKKAKKDGQFRRFLWDNHAAASKCGVQAILFAYKHNMTCEEAERACYLRNTQIALVARRIPSAKGTKIDRARLLDYVDSNDIGYDVYDDYLASIKALGYDLSDTKNLYPRDFKQMHDLRSAEYASWKVKQDRKKRRTLYRDFRRVAKSLMGFEAQGDKYSLVIPREVSELTEEGNALSHCVGQLGYDKKMIEGKSFIIFCRENVDLKKPFATIEFDLNTNKVRQFYAEHNSRPPEDAIEFVNTWAESVKEIRTKGDSNETSNNQIQQR